MELNLTQVQKNVTHFSSSETEMCFQIFALYLFRKNDTLGYQTLNIFIALKFYQTLNDTLRFGK